MPLLDVGAAIQDLSAENEGSMPIGEPLPNAVLSLPIGPHLAMADGELLADAVRAVTA